MSIMDYARHASEAAINLAAVPDKVRDNALRAIADALLASEGEIVAANIGDLERASAEGLPQPLVKRLKFDRAKIDECVAGLHALADMPDPLGRILLKRELDEGLVLKRISCPIGVIGVIFESRPDALVQIAGLCLKSGNSVLLKGGSEAAASNRALFDVILGAAVKAGIPAGSMALLETRDDVNELLKCDQYVDLIIPRGSNEFVKYIKDNSDILVMGHADGICHVYVDRAADTDKALAIAVDSKTQYVAVCNAAETLIVHSDIAGGFLPELKARMEEKGVELFGCERTAALIPVTPAGEDTYDTEYLDYKMSVKIVDSSDEAIAHINSHGSGHTDAIVTEDGETARKFTSLVDSAGVYINCSTRFADGYRYGFGAEVGIATGKLHARGPVGLDGLLTYKYLLEGDGHIVSDYADGKREFSFKDLDIG